MDVQHGAGNMEVEAAEFALAALAGAIADPARSRMLCSLLDGRARTATELAAVADVTAPMASNHFSRLREQGLVELMVQGRHRYYRLANSHVAQVLESLLSITRPRAAPFQPSTPDALRHARTCYDHCAGEIAVRLHDALLTANWIEAQGKDYALTEKGAERLLGLGIDVDEMLSQRRRLAYPCMDWSERSSHIGGALGAALLALLLKRGWLSRQLDSRALQVTSKGRAGLAKAFSI